AISELDDVFLYSVDDLEQVIGENRRSRREAAEQAEAVIDLRVEHCLSWWRASSEQDTRKQLRPAAETSRGAVLARAGEMLAQGRSPQQALEYLAHTLTNKLLHAPSVALRQAAQQGDRELLHAAARLFDSSDRAASTDANPDSDDAQHPPQARRTG